MRKAAGRRGAAETQAQEEMMRKLVAFVLAATFAAVSVQAIAQQKDTKPTKEQCAKDPKMKGCEKK